MFVPTRVCNMKTVKSFVYKSSVAFVLFVAVLTGTRNCKNPVDTLQMSKEDRLDKLFAHLKTTQDPYQTVVLEEKILKLLLSSDEQEINALMGEGVAALTEGEFDDAVDHFSAVIEKRPQYTEAWNKRATSFYMQGKIDSALLDIEQTLVLESRHFGALSGLASIYLMKGQENKALKIYERIARIAPAEPHIQQQIQHLRGKMGISAI